MTAHILDTRPGTVDARLMDAIGREVAETGHAEFRWTAHGSDANIIVSLRKKDEFPNSFWFGLHLTNIISVDSGESAAAYATYFNGKVGHTSDRAALAEIIRQLQVSIKANRSRQQNGIHQIAAEITHEFGIPTLVVEDME